MEIVRRVKIDVARENVFAPIQAKQSDANSRFLDVTVSDQGEVLTVPSTATVLINARRRDDTSKSFAGSVNTDGTVRVPLSAWMLEHDGDVLCDISIISDSERLTTMSFVLKVQRVANAGSDTSQDENYDVLLSLVQKTSTAATSATNAAAAANAAATKATNAAATVGTVTLGISSASAGDIIKVKTVDTQGRPSDWETIGTIEADDEADGIPSWVKVGEWTAPTGEQAATFMKDVDVSGFRHIRMLCVIPNAADANAKTRCFLKCGTKKQYITYSVPTSTTKNTCALIDLFFWSDKIEYEICCGEVMGDEQFNGTDVSSLYSIRKGLIDSEDFKPANITACGCEIQNSSTTYLDGMNMAVYGIKAGGSV